MSQYYAFDHQYLLNGNTITIRLGGATLYETSSPDGDFDVGEILVEEPADLALGITYTYLGRFLDGIAIMENFNIGRTFVLTYEEHSYGDFGGIVEKSFHPAPVPGIPAPTDGDDRVNAGDYDHKAITLHFLDGDDQLFGVSGTYRDWIWGDGGNDSISTGQGKDHLFGGAGADMLSGGDQDDYLIGGAGNDQLNGGSGNDVLKGGKGADTLYGQDGDDVLIGGEGRDFLWGSYGNDRFVFATGDGVDEIYQFSIASDTLDFRQVAGLDSIKDLHIRNVEDGLMINYGSGKVLLDDMTRADFHALDILI